MSIDYVNGDVNMSAQMRLLDRAEAAERCRISVDTLNYLRAVGRFAPAIRVGRRVFFDAHDIELWLIEQKESAA